MRSAGRGEHAAAGPPLVYLVRHAEADVPGGARRFVGQLDVPLSVAGREQARRLADRLRSVGFDAIHSSDLRRCLLTAQIVAEASGLPVQEESRLREIDTGLWTGLTFEEAKELYPKEHREREGDLVGRRFPGGESFVDLQERVVPALLDISKAGGRTILVVSHKGVNRVLLCHFRGLPLEQAFSIPQDYCSVETIQL